MYYQHEVKGVFINHAIEYQHGLNGEMPWAGTIGRRYDNGYRSHHEGYQCTPQSQMLREVKAEEREVVVQEVAYPDAEGEEDKKRQVSDIFQRDDTLPDAPDSGFHLTLYIKAAEEYVYQNQDGHYADGSNQIARQ